MRASLSLSSLFIDAVISSAVSNGPTGRPLVRLLSDSRKRASIIRRCAGVYTSSASVTSTAFGVSTIVPRCSDASTGITLGQTYGGAETPGYCPLAVVLDFRESGHDVLCQLSPTKECRVPQPPSRTPVRRIVRSNAPRFPVGIHSNNSEKSCADMVARECRVRRRQWRGTAR